MGRPTKTGLNYFPFDVDLFQDEKVVAIAGEFGLKGEIIIVKLLCAIYRNGYFIEWNELMKFKLLKDLPGVSAELLDSVIARLVRWGFFNEDLFDSAHILTSRGIQQRYFEVARKRKGDGQMTYSLLENDPEKSFFRGNSAKNAVSSAETRVSAAEMQQSKVNKSKYTPSVSPSSGDPPQQQRNFIEIFFAPHRNEMVRQFCEKIGLEDDAGFSRLRALVANADNYLAMNEERFDCFADWCRSIQNLVRAEMRREKSLAQNVSTKPNLCRRPATGTAATPPVAAACRVERRPNSDSQI